MDLNSAQVFPITESSQAAAARRAGAVLAVRAGLDDVMGGKVAVVVTEAATNLIKHAGGGEIVVAPLEDAAGRGVEVLALDKGPGMANVSEYQRDGHSTTGTAGTGLGAIARMATFSDIYSRPGQGTVLLARFFVPRRSSPLGEPTMEVSGVSVAKKGEDVCGDGWAADVHGPLAVILVADGLGHGPAAADAAREAVKTLRVGADERPAVILEAAHGALRGTRGAAVAVTSIDSGRGVVTFAGVGNIAGAIVTNGASRSVVSLNGIVGHQIRTVREFSYPWADDAVLVLHSDGLISHWSLDAYPGLAHRHPSLIAGVLYRDFTRRRDDVTVVVAKRRAA
jgi:anti-sigma regulatory factor (Ser/Thr protein kinase)